MLIAPFNFFTIVTTTEFNSCVDLFADNLYRFILKNVRDEDEAHDIVQATYEKVWLKAADVAYEKGKSYLFTTAYRTMLARLKQKNRFSPLDHTLHTLSTDDTTEFDVKKVLNQAIQQLPADQRSVVMLRDYEGYSYHEIAEITGLNESQVKVYIYRARLFLKNFIVQTGNLI